MTDSTNRTNRLLKGLILFSGAAIVILLSATVTMKLTSKPAFCASCHQIKPVVTAWETGPHSKVDCMSCHVEPGKFGYVKRKIGGIKEVYQQITGSFDPNNLNPEINLNTCIDCHTKGNKKYPTAANIASSSMHVPILENKTSCLGCHLEVGHGEFSKGKEVKVTQ